MLHIGPCTAEDVVVLERHLGSGRNRIHEQLHARQQAGDATYLVAWRGGIPVGTGLVRWRDANAKLPGTPEISNLGVPAELRGQGIGTALVRAAEDAVRDRGLSRVAIAVGDDNPDASRLYSRLGYADSGRRWTATYATFDDDGVEHHVTESGPVLVRHV